MSNTRLLLKEIRVSSDRHCYIASDGPCPLYLHGLCWLDNQRPQRPDTDKAANALLRTPECLACDAMSVLDNDSISDVNSLRHVLDSLAEDNRLLSDRIERLVQGAKKGDYD